MQANMAEDLAHKRPYLLGSLIAGISFPATWLFLPIDGGLYAIIWKMAAVGLLVLFVMLMPLWLNVALVPRLWLGQLLHKLLWKVPSKLLLRTLLRSRALKCKT
jgi:hypothetical protein